MLGLLGAGSSILSAFNRKNPYGKMKGYGDEAMQNYRDFMDENSSRYTDFYNQAYKRNVGLAKESSDAVLNQLAQTIDPRSAGALARQANMEGLRKGTSQLDDAMLDVRRQNMGLANDYFGKAGDAYKQYGEGEKIIFDDKMGALQQGAIAGIALEDTPFGQQLDDTVGKYADKAANFIGENVFGRSTGRSMEEFLRSIVPSQPPQEVVNNTGFKSPFQTRQYMAKPAKLNLMNFLPQFGKRK